MFTNDTIQDVIEKAKNTVVNLMSDGQKEKALAIIEQIHKTCPEDLESLQLLAWVRKLNQDNSGAIDAFSKIIELEPNNCETYNNIALCHGHVGEYQEAIDNLQIAIDRSTTPCHYFFSNIALQYRCVGKYQEAIENFKIALDLNRSKETLSSLGGCYAENREFDKAEKCFKEALELDPNFATAHFDLASTYLDSEKWDQAWPEYEWRFSILDQLKVWYRVLDANKKWHGESLAGKTLLIHTEQGFGDTIQFFRYISLCKEAEKIILYCDISTKDLFEDYVDEIFTENPKTVDIKNVPKYDYQCSLLSLPYVFKGQIPSDPYLKSKKEFNLNTYEGCKVGIIWAGNPQHPNDKNRSLHLSHFKSLLEIPGIKLFSLVKDTRPRIYKFSKEPIDLISDTENMDLVDMSPHLNSYGDTAAIIDALDLIISVDTSTLHLAGALGKPVWGLIPFIPDWRWKQSGTDTVWYPTMKLFRQPIAGDWKSVFENVKKELYEFRFR